MCHEKLKERSIKELAKKHREQTIRIRKEAGRKRLHRTTYNSKAKKVKLKV